MIQPTSNLNKINLFLFNNFFAIIGAIKGTIQTFMCEYYRNFNIEPPRIGINCMQDT